MICSNIVNESTDKYEEYIEDEREYEKDLKELICSHDLLMKDLKSFLLKLSIDELINLIKYIYEFKIKYDHIQYQINFIQNQINSNKQQLNLIKNQFFISNIQQLNKDIQQLKLDLQEILSQENRNILSNNLTIEKVNHTSNLDINEKHFPLIQSEDEDEEEEEEDEELVAFVNSDSTLRINQKIRLSNNIVRWLRGPIKVMLDGTMHAVDVCAQGTHISDSALQAVKQGLDKQKMTLSKEEEEEEEEEIVNNSMKYPFIEITSEWKFQEENSDRGYSSPSIWMINKKNKMRFLFKIQELPLCAANEWLAYVLGRYLGLPINHVQISIYENNLITIHKDVAKYNEKTITFMDLPKQKRRTILTYPIIESMDLFDKIIQNVDRNPRNILITILKKNHINDENIKLKIHFIDHSSCFGMGKLNGISVVASKFHSNHLAVVKFDPIHKSKQFEKYLKKLPIEDRPLISKTLHRFATITDYQFDSWINQIKDLLSISQYNRIQNVLRKQRDIAKFYSIQWGFSNMK
ncbi:unnamed protein product [Adineta steineri]|uniref:Uncharacterized protein n=1 Tax=Adineta steineri TaxID=433720 RepID=A0A815P3G6_9BILA|nr:unnamed protein product [Adineta steineri]